MGVGGAARRPRLSLGPALGPGPAQLAGGPRHAHHARRRLPAGRHARRHPRPGRQRLGMDGHTLRRLPLPPAANLENPDATGLRVAHGGGWAANRRMVRCAYRDRDNPWGRDNNLGYRLARSLWWFWPSVLCPLSSFLPPPQAANRIFCARSSIQPRLGAAGSWFKSSSTGPACRRSAPSAGPADHTDTPRSTRWCSCRGRPGSAPAHGSVATPRLPGHCR